MKILALIELAAEVRVEDLRARVVDEVRASWALFAQGVLREAYLTDVPTRVAFVLEADGAPQAAEQLGQLPMVTAGLVRLELVELRPFVNWSMLFSR